ARVLRRLRGQREVPAELGLQHAVEPLQLLLLAEADAVLAQLALAAPVHAGRLVAVVPVDRALGGVASRAFQVQLHALAPAALANGVGVAGHLQVSGVRGQGSGPDSGESCLTPVS